MIPLRTMPVKRKVTLLMLLTSALVLCAATGAFFVYALVTHRQSFTHDLTVLSRIVADNCDAALAFNDGKAAEGVLAALKAREDIVAACIQLPDGSLFASFGHPTDLDRKLNLEPDGTQFEGRYLTSTTAISADNERLGTLHLRSDYQAVYRRLIGWLLVLLALVFAGSGLFAWLLSTWLQRLISEPILKLAATARAVAESKDYSLRAEHITDDELGLLVITFNQMVEQVAERTASLRQAKELAEGASVAKSQFLAMMSHEIRTPLNGVTSALHLLQKGALSSQQRRWIDMAFTSASTLLRVINDVLDFSKVEAGKLDFHLSPTRLTETIGRTVAAFAEKAAAKGLAWHLQIDPDIPRQVETDADRLVQVLSNLLGNAVKFTDTGAVSLNVRIHSATAGQARVRFAVIDTGPGISPVHQQRLFKPFSQADSSTSRRHGGTGLGLGICKQLVELMGGEIGVQSAPGQGSTFWFELPFKIPPPPAESRDAVGTRHPTAAAPPVSMSRPIEGRALLADDNAINQELAVELIRAIGIECDCVADGYEAVQAACTGGYAVVLMDCMMPGMDGYEAAKAIRAEEARLAQPGEPRRRLPIIAMTAGAMKGDREACLQAGMDDYLSKPLDPEALSSVLRRWLAADPQADAPFPASDAPAQGDPSSAVRDGDAFP